MDNTVVSFPYAYSGKTLVCQRLRIDFCECPSLREVANHPRTSALKILCQILKDAEAVGSHKLSEGQAC